MVLKKKVVINININEFKELKNNILNYEKELEFFFINNAKNSFMLMSFVRHLSDKRKELLKKDLLHKNFPNKSLKDKSIKDFRKNTNFLKQCDNIFKNDDILNHYNNIISYSDLSENEFEEYIKYLKTPKHIKKMKNKDDYSSINKNFKNSINKLSYSMKDYVNNIDIDSLIMNNLDVLVNKLIEKVTDYLLNIKELNDKDFHNNIYYYNYHVYDLKDYDCAIKEF